MELKGQITVSRFQSNEEPYTGIQIEIVDSLSRAIILRAEMSVVAFGNLVTGLSYQDITFELSGLANVGKEKVMKYETLEFNSYPNYEALQIAAKPFEQDGWVFNFYKGSKIEPFRGEHLDYAVKVPFVRFEGGDHA